MTRNGSSKLLTPARLARWGWLMLGAIVVAFVIVVATASGIDTVGGGRLGGDWAPFRTAGVLALRDPSSLLDPAAQYAEMSRYLEGGLLPFANPPLFAFLFVPAAWMSFSTGYVVWVVLLALAAAVAARATLDVLGVHNPEWRRVGVLGAMTFGFAARSYTGAQNSTITLMLLAVGLRHLQRGRPWTAGVVLGALWFKPQFAVPVIGLLVVARHVRSAAAMVGMGGLLWAGHAAVFGSDWTGRWLADIVRVTDEGNRVFNLARTTSPVEYLRWAIDGTAGDVAGFGLAAGLGALAAWLAWRHLRQPRQLLPLVCVALLVTSLHSLFYELTLLIPAVGAGVVLRDEEAGVRGGLALWAAAPAVVAITHPLVRIAYLGLATAWWLRPTVRSLSAGSRRS